MPQLPSLVLPNGIIVYVWHITESQEILQQMYEECHLPQRKSTIVNGDISDFDGLTVSPQHKHFLASRLLLNSVFGNYRMGRSNDGKPHLEYVEHADIHINNTHINYSHADNWVVLACHPEFKVGIDIESPRPQLHRIYRRFCSEKEILWMGENPSTLQLQKAWCAKEALYKAIGKKGTDFRDQLYLQPTQETEMEMKATILLKIGNSESTTNYGDELKSSNTPIQTTVHFFSLESMMVAAVTLNN